MRWTRTHRAAIALAVLALAAVPLAMNVARNGKAEDPQAGERRGPAPAGFAMPVEVAPVTIGPISETLTAVGTLAANESVMIRPEIPGRVTRVNFREGQAVEQGRVLIELDAGELEAQLAQAAANREIARLNYDRMKRLIANDNVSRQELDQAATTLKAAEANYRLFEERLSKTRIRSPFAGHLGTRRVSPGDYVQPGRDIVNLEDLTTVKIDFMVPETYFSRLSVGQQVRVHVDAFAGTAFTGEVYSIDPRVDELSRTVRVRARIPNPGVKLRPGMFANVSLVLGRTEDALLIPEEAVVPQQDNASVFRVEEGVARLTEVKLGARERGLVQVVEGLKASDTVVRAGHQKIRDGLPVQPVERGQVEALVQ
ncbi:efflux RND transporter periplasmic adaptor subunit [Candidatus Nitrospira bockiana]